ncbi:MAG: ATP-binding protein [Planctomycetota bacterium]
MDESLPSSSPGHWSVSARIGIAFAVTAGFLLACSFISFYGPPSDRLQAVLWVTAIAACSLGGLVSMRNLRTLKSVESELRRASRGHVDWRSARPIFGSDPVTDGWNRLLTQVNESNQSTETVRQVAPLDEEATTLARGMRALPLAWIISDSSGRLRFANPATYRLLGISEEDAGEGTDVMRMLGLRGASLGNSASDISEDVSDDEAKARQVETAELIDQMLGPIRSIRKRISIHTATQALQVRVSRSRLAGRQGDADGMIWTLNDVTQEQLATAARDDFLMTATHELRTPLNNLQAYAEVLGDSDGVEPDQQREFCNIIIAESVRLSRLVDHLLSVGQMEAGSMVASRHELDWLPMVEYAIEHCQSEAEKKSIELTQDLSAKLPTVFGDRDKLQAAMANLVGNAVKYTPEGGKVIVRCYADEKSILTEIQDNGIGIAEEDQEKVFEKFYRCDSASESSERGNGLGLAFAAEVAKVHGGSLELESELGSGSTFTMRLPIGGASRSGI